MLLGPGAGINMGRQLHGLEDYLSLELLSKQALKLLSELLSELCSFTTEQYRIEDDRLRLLIAAFEL